MEMLVRKTWILGGSWLVTKTNKWEKRPMYYYFEIVKAFMLLSILGPTVIVIRPLKVNILTPFGS